MSKFSIIKVEIFDAETGETIRYRKRIEKNSNQEMNGKIADWLINVKPCNNGKLDSVDLKK